MSALDIFFEGFEREVEAYRGLNEAASLRKLAEAANDEWREPGSTIPLGDGLFAAAEAGSLAAAAGLHVLSLVDPSVKPMAERAIYAVASRSSEIRESLVIEGLTSLIEQECERQGMVREEVDGQVVYRKPDGGAT